MGRRISKMWLGRWDMGGTSRNELGILLWWHHQIQTAYFSNLNVEVERSVVVEHWGNLKSALVFIEDQSILN